MNTRGKINLLIIVFLASAILLIAFAVYSIFGEIVKSSKDLVSRKKDLAVLEAKIQSLEGFTVLYQDLGDILERIDGLFIDPEVPVGFISFLEQTSIESGVNIEISLTPVDKNKKDAWPYFTFQITVIGSFPNFLSYLERLEASQYLVEIQSMNISRVGEKDGVLSNDIKASFSAKVFTK